MNPYNPLAGPSSSPSSSQSDEAPHLSNGAGPLGISRSGTTGGGGASTSASTALGPLVEPHQELNDFLETFWTRQMDYVEKENPDFRTYPLPLARIKKVMKSDEEVKMISAEAPIMFSRACETELTCRAWLIAESNKRRTLQKSDVAAAIGLSDMFDFLIDILPRDDEEGGEGEGAGQDGGEGEAEDGVMVEEDEGAGEGDEGAEGGVGSRGGQGMGYTDGLRSAGGVEGVEGAPGAARGAGLHGNANRDGDARIHRHVDAQYQDANGHGRSNTHQQQSRQQAHGRGQGQGQGQGQMGIYNGMY